MAQLVEQLLPTPRSAVQIPTSAIFYLPIVHLNREDKNREKEAGNGSSKKINMNSLKFDQHGSVIVDNDSIFKTENHCIRPKAFKLRFLVIYIFDIISSKT